MSFKDFNRCVCGKVFLVYGYQRCDCHGRSIMKMGSRSLNNLCGDCACKAYEASKAKAVPAAAGHEHVSPPDPEQEKLRAEFMAEKK